MIVGFLLARQCQRFQQPLLPSPAVLSGSVLGKVSEFQDGARTKWAFPALENGRMKVP